VSAETRRRDVACAALLAAMPLLLFADTLVARSGFFVRDLYTYHFPLAQSVRAILARGELPLWNRAFFGGQPLAANPAYKLFYPLQWLVFAFEPPLGFSLCVLAHLELALAGMYALLRALALRPAAAVFGALSFGLGGFLLGSMTNAEMLFVWSWAPLLYLLLLRLVQQPSRARFAAAAVIAAMPMLLAEPMALAQLWLIAIAVAMRRRRALALVLGVAVASVLLAAIQLLPMLDFVRDSVRAHGFAFSTVADWSMPPIRPLELLRPGAVPASAFPRGTAYVPAIYCGLLVVILAVTGFIVRARGALIAALLALLSYVLAIGDHTPLLRLLYAAGARMIRYPEKFIGMGVFTLIVFAAIVADLLLAGEKRAQLVALIVAWCAAIVVHSLVAVAFAALLTLYWRWPRRELVLALLCVLLADLGLQVNRIAPRAPYALFTPPPIVSLLDRDAVLFPRQRWLGTPDQQRYQSVCGPCFQRSALYPLTPVAWGLRLDLEADIDETALAVTHELLDAMMRYARPHARWSEPFMTLAGVRYVADYRPFDVVMSEANGNPLFWSPARVQHVPDQGRYWFAQRVVQTRDLATALDRVPDVRGVAFVPFPPFAPAPGRVLALRETSNTADVDVLAGGTALLVITVTRHRYWSATIDGRPSALRPTNVAYQSLVVPPGHHHVALRYRNPMLAAGAAVLLLTLAALTVPTPRRRRPRSGS
jgi:Bacterial membrane protein YfhO